MKMRGLVLFLLAIAAVSTATESEQFKCEPGTTFMKECNTCMCLSDGTSAACTRKACLSGIFNEDGSLKEQTNNDIDETREKRDVEKQNASDSEQFECEPGTTFMKECNTCMCSTDGTSAACTRKACYSDIFNEDGSVKERKNDNVDATGEKLDVEKTKICVPGTITRNYCNTCFCTADGTKLECTKKPCPRGEFERNGQRSYQHFDIRWSKKKRQADEIERKRICEPGKVFKKYCNSCRCSSDGKDAACTRMFCPPRAYNFNGTRTGNWHRAVRKFGGITNFTESRSCEPGRFYHYYCNDCQCSRDGRSAACTLMSCPEGVFAQNGTRIDTQDRRVQTFLRPVTYQYYYQPEMWLRVHSVCAPGQLFKNYCNDCRCLSNGRTADCTYRACPPGVYNMDGTRVDGSDRPVQNVPPATGITVQSVCAPNTVFKNYCNTCRCSNDGRFATCTYQECPAGVYNKDGTRVDGSDRPVQHVPPATGITVQSVCAPNTVFKNYCNTCRCSNDGRFATCTYQECPAGVYNKDGTRVDGSDRPVQHVPPATGITVQSVCAPNTVFRNYCNTCRCSNDGRFATCTYQECPAGVYNKDGTRVDGSDRPLHPTGNTVNVASVCTPGQKFNNYCNTCRCNSDAKSASCTYLVCPVGVYNIDGTRIDGTDRQPQYLPTGMTVNVQSVCRPGQNFNNYCNKCRCSDNGNIAACTYLACPPGIYNRDGTRADGLDRPSPLVCQPGKSFKSFCNTCQCSLDGKSASCTYKKCPPGVYNENGALVAQSRQTLNDDASRVCEPGKSYRQDCNSCVCSEDGTNAVCTLRMCTE